MPIELLGDRHCREGFDCGVAVLDEFLSCQARQRRGLGKTYVALAGNSADVTGFVTVSAGQVVTRTLPAHLKPPYPPAPILRVVRLAADGRYQGRGIGHDLLAFALRLALDFSARIGLYAVVIDARDAKDGRAAGFYRRLDFLPTLSDPLCLFLPLLRLKQTESER